MVLEEVEKASEEAIPTIRLKHFRRLLLIAFLILLLGVVFAGLKMITGYILGYLAAISFVVALICRWRKIRYFLILFGVSIFGAIFLSMIYVEVIVRVCGAVFGEGVFASTGWKIFDVFVSNMIIFFTPVGVLVGIAGSLVLYINRITSGDQKGA
jgi:asparagine N-glycosylation enzyme membrane subunit Stt3